jgi:hypothetical protein
VLWTARSGSGSPPERGVREVVVRRAGARRDEGLVVEDRPRAELDVRVAMGAGYATVTQDSRVTRGAEAGNRRPGSTRDDLEEEGAAAFPVHLTPCGLMHRATWAPLLGAHVEA